MRLLIFILGALACVAIPPLFHKLGSPPANDPPRLDESEIEFLDMESPEAEANER